MTRPHTTQSTARAAASPTPVRRPAAASACYDSQCRTPGFAVSGLHFIQFYCCLLCCKPGRPWWVEHLHFGCDDESRVGTAIQHPAGCMQEQAQSRQSTALLATCSLASLTLQQGALLHMPWYSTARTTTSAHRTLVGCLITERAAKHGESFRCRARLVNTCSTPCIYCPREGRCRRMGRSAGVVWRAFAWGPRTMHCAHTRVASTVKCYQV